MSLSNLLRNKELKFDLIIFLFIYFTGIIVGFYLDIRCGFLALIMGFLFFLLYLFSNYRRYSRLANLSQDIDRMLHQQTPIPFEKYREGELSILENELSKMTLRLTEQAESLLQDKRYLSDTIADLSHQLRSPLTSLQLVTTMLKDASVGSDSWCKLLIEQNQLLSHMSWLIEAMLKMAKMDANTAYLKSEPISVWELITKACEPFLIPMELHSQTIIRHLPDTDSSFTGDLNWTVEAIQNILKNCTEHISSGGEIRIQAESNTLLTEIIIEDNGSGFSPEDLPHLFERFYKGSSSGSQSVGIGLALSRMIISAQNGTVKAENIPQGGARFIIHFYHNTTI